MAEDSDIRLGVAQRFEFIEWRAYWVGRINRKDLEDRFDISTPQASVDLRRYQEAAPGNIEYDSTEKSYVATDGFNPQFLKLIPERYLLQLHAFELGAIRKSDTWFGEIPPTSVTPTLLRGPEAYVLRAIVNCIRMNGAIDINYQSLTKTAVRTICPHALAYDGYRWHIRALSLEHNEYRDYVLGRILSVSNPVSCNSNSSDDREWQTEYTLTLIAHPKLSPQQKAAIEHDFKFKNGELAIPMRFALAYYFINRYNLDLRNDEIPPQRAQIYLKNYDEFKTAWEQVKEESKILIKQRGVQTNKAI
jgi:hypothetical protein